MKQIITFKNLLIASCFAAGSLANTASAQIHPLAFGPHLLGTSTTPTASNFYADYVGLRFLVNSPTSVEGPKVYSFAKTGTAGWGGGVTAPINNVSIRMPQTPDSLATSAISASTGMAGHIAFIYRGTNEFVCKALAAQTAGAIACVIVNNISGGPIGMGAGTVCTAASVTIPVFMISKEDGDAIDALYWAGDTAHFTITPWGLGFAQDMGFVPGGTAEWHSFAVPANQVALTGNPPEYNMENTAFIANYGSGDLHNVKVAGTLSFTPDETHVTTAQHSDTVSLASFPAHDSIYAMVGPSEYSIAANGAKGRFDIRYDIIPAPDQIDQYPADNSYTSSFYLTDSLYSKGRYDMTGNTGPIRTEFFSFNGGSDFLWGPMYFVKNAGTFISRVQYSMSKNATGPLTGPTDIFLFTWTDGSGGQPKDSVLQDGELNLISLGVHVYDGVNDTSSGLLNFSGMGDPTSGNPANIALPANTWLYLAVAVPGGSFLGSDGLLNPYPRTYGRFHKNSAMLDYNSLIAASSDEISTNPAINNSPLPSTGALGVFAVDSFVYSSMKGLIPAVAMIVRDHPLAVENAPAKSQADVNLFPNPASDKITVSLNLESQSKTVTYSIIDGLGRFVSKEVHNNVQSETFDLNTKSLASGHYFLIINFNDKAIARNFVIAK